MAENGSVDLTAEQALGFVKQLTNEARAQLLLAATRVPIDVDLLEEPKLEVLNIGQIESGQKPMFVCPHIGCEQPFRPENLASVAYHQRIEQPTEAEYGDLTDDPVTGYLHLPNHGERDGDEWKQHAFFCPSCARPIKLPPKWGY